MKNRTKTSNNSKPTILDIARGAIIACILSVVAVLVLALVVKLTALSENAILPINQVIKILSILGGCLFGIKDKSGGALKGAVIGMLYALISIFIFLIINKTLQAGSISFIDMLASVIAGAVSGIIAVNVRKK